MILALIMLLAQPSQASTNCLSLLSFEQVEEELLCYEDYSLGYGENQCRAKKPKIKGFKIVEKLGSGYRAKVWLTSDGQAIKIARSAKDSHKLHMEAIINQQLKENYKIYGIRTDEILKVGPAYSYLLKKLINKENLANKILKKNEKLTKEQLSSLKKVFLGAKKYAVDTGIGLDLKSANLYWDDNLNEWILFDCGPRTSYLPFGFTLSIKDFAEYLQEWTYEEPAQ